MYEITCKKSQKYCSSTVQICIEGAMSLRMHHEKQWYFLSSLSFGIDLSETSSLGIILDLFTSVIASLLFFYIFVPLVCGFLQFESYCKLT